MRRRILALALGASLAAACSGEGAPSTERGGADGRVPVVSAPEPASSPAPTASASSSARAPRPQRPPTPREREGDTSVEALFDRAREALMSGDDLVVVRCLAPEARRAWLSDVLLAIEVEAQDPRYQHELARRRAVGLLRDRVLSHVRGGEPGDPPPSLGAAAVGAALLDRIDDPDVLLAELLQVARGLGHPLDPIGAVDHGRLGDTRPRPPPAPTAWPAGLSRALRRVERSRDLAEVHLEDGAGIALVRLPDGGLEPIRILRRGDTLWLDES